MAVPDFLVPARIVFGRGAFTQLGGHAARFKPKRVLLVTGRKAMQKTGKLFEAVQQLRKFHPVVYEGVEENPCVETVDDCAQVARECKADLVVGLGGGSPLDVAKAAAIMATHSGSVLDYLDGRKALKRPGLPFIALPTTAGTGSEVTKASVITDRCARTKKVLKHEWLSPSVALVDPLLTVSCPKFVTAAAGFDALTHAIESYVCLKATPFTDALNEQAISLVWENLSSAWRKPKDLTARENVLLGSTLAGMTIANTGVGACHAVTHSLGGKFNVVHGEGNALLLPHVIDYNLRAARRKYQAVAELLGEKKADNLASVIARATKKMGLRARLSELGVAQSDLAWIAKDSFRGSMAVNPRKATQAGIVEMLKKAL